MSATLERLERETGDEEAEVRRTWTAADLAAVPSDLPSGPACDELWDGELRLGLVPDLNHGSVLAQIGVALDLWRQKYGGRAWVRTGVVLSQEPATVFAPDVSLATADQLPVRRSPEEWLVTVPALVVEVRAFMESISELEGKVWKYLRAGARLVWLADPETRAIQTYAAGQAPRTFRTGEELTAVGVLDGFRWPVDRLFEGVVHLEPLDGRRGSDGNGAAFGAVVRWSEADGRWVRRRFWRAADMAALPGQLPTGPARYEVWDGELRLMPPMGDWHGSVLLNFGTMLKIHGQWEGHGRVTGADVGVVVQPESPENAFGADVAFLTSDQLPVNHSRQDYLLTIPAIVVEVCSKNDTLKEIREKVRRYLEAGVRLVWVADQKKHAVTAYRPEQDPVVLSEDDVLTAEGIIPNLAFSVRRLFEGLE